MASQMSFPWRSFRASTREQGCPRIAQRLIRDQPVQQTQQFAHVFHIKPRHGFEHARFESDAAFIRTAFHDGEAGLDIGALNVGQQAPLKPTSQPILEG